MSQSGFLLISEKGQPGGVEIEGSAERVIANHKAEDDAHTPLQVGADAQGTAHALMLLHLDEGHPHKQYSLEINRIADKQALANSIIEVKANSEPKGAASAALSAHKNEVSAHTPTQVGADPAGTAQSVISTHESSSNHPVATATTKGMMSPGDKNKLDGIISGATKNATDVQLRERSSHTGEQAIGTITGLQVALDNKQAILPITSAGLALIDDADVVAQRATLGLGLGALQNIDLGGKRHTRSRTAPVNPQIGDSWDELDASDQFIHSWFWNGVYWLSERIYIKEPSINNISSNLQIYYELPSDTNIFVVGFKPNVLLGSTNTTNSNWAFTLNRTGTSTVALATASSSATAPNGWFSNFVAVNTHINVVATGSKAFRIDISKNSVASNISGSVAIFYRLARF